MRQVGPILFRMGPLCALIAALTAHAGGPYSDPPVAAIEAEVGEKMLIPAGEFLMGRDEDPTAPEAPRHPVWTDAYEIGKFEVTWDQFQRFIDAGGYQDRANNGYWSRRGAALAEVQLWWVDGQPRQKLEAPAWTPGGSGPPEFAQAGHWPPNPNDPVVGVSYWEAEAYCRFVGGRLPTEAEWEKAAVWGPDFTAPRTFPWGESSTLPLPCNGYEASEGHSSIASVDLPRYSGDQSAYGVRGLGGNVQEWVADMWDPEFYLQGPALVETWLNPFNFQARRFDHVDAVGGQPPIAFCIRGAHWGMGTNILAPFRSATRFNVNEFFRNQVLGFRVAWDVRAKAPPPPVTRQGEPGEAVFIPGGEYLVGHTTGMPVDTGASPAESPQHPVCLDPFWIGKFEVTWGEYKRFMELGGYGDPTGPRPSWWTEEGWRYRLHPNSENGGPGIPVERPVLLGLSRPKLGTEQFVLWKGPWAENGAWSSPPDDHPAMSISWFEAEAYCRFVGGRLPKEVEWEVAATWNPETNRPMQYPWGNLFTFPTEDVFGNSGDDPKYRGVQTCPVGMYPEGRSPFGCFDMAGNVFEWTEDWFSDRSYTFHESRCGGRITTPDSERQQGACVAWGVKVNRGGGFDPAFEGTGSQRGRSRGHDGCQGFRHYTFGVRVVWDRDPAQLPEAQRVRPPRQVEQARQAAVAAKVSAPVLKAVSLGLAPVEESGALDRPGKEYWYRVEGAPGEWVTIDLDANGGSDDKTGLSNLDAVIEIHQPGFEVPVRRLDDELVPIADSAHRDYFLDPPIFRHRIPREGYFTARVKAYSWPAEGSQAGLSEGERSHTGADYLFRITFTGGTVEPNTADLDGNGWVNAEDLLLILEGRHAPGEGQGKTDLSGNGVFDAADLFRFSMSWAGTNP
ncbi:MAG: Hercynine oxygenase [bacterium]|nr:Hercynine oxygenase [bacterium]